MRRSNPRWLWGALALALGSLLLSWLLHAWFPVFVFVLFLPLRQVGRLWPRGRGSGQDSAGPDGVEPPD